MKEVKESYNNKVHYNAFLAFYWLHGGSGTVNYTQTRAKESPRRLTFIDDNYICGPTTSTCKTLFKSTPRRRKMFSTAGEDGKTVLTSKTREFPARSNLVPFGTSIRAGV